jgi:hypothetical protein
MTAVFLFLKKEIKLHQIDKLKTQSISSYQGHSWLENIPG